MPHPHQPPRVPGGGPRPSPGPSRRRVLQQATFAALGLPTAAGLLGACGSPAGAGPAPALTLASPQHPVTWPISADNPVIADGLSPEQDATLQIYTYADYIDPGAISSFEKKYAGTKVAVSTFNDTDEALTKIRSGGVPYDLYFPSYDQISRMVSAKLVRPLAHSYVPGISNVWPVFSDPWYDREWRYTVPYTVYTTGIGWRTDRVKEDVAARTNPYDVLWDPAYRNRTAVIDDWHTAMAMVLLRDGITDINTASAADLARVGRDLAALAGATRPKVTVTMYNDLPAGGLGVTQMWSGDVVQALSYLPGSVPPGVLRYWFPPDGKGMVDNDLMVVLSGGSNPVLAHLFIEHMLTPETALANYSYIGYQPPQRTLDPATLVAQEYLPATLAGAVVKEEYFTSGYRLLELDTANDAAWHTVWQAFTAGG